MSTTTQRRYFVMVNRYRSSTDEGFGNTWRIRECHNAAQQRRILREGLPVNDQQLLDKDGHRSPCYSTKGIRVATSSEIRAAKREEEAGVAIELSDFYMADE